MFMDPEVRPQWIIIYNIKIFFIFFKKGLNADLL